MPMDHLQRRRLDVVFGLLLTSGVMVGAYFLWAVADWIHSQGEGAFGLYYLGVFSFVPSLLAGLTGGAHMLVAPGNRDVRLGVVLTAVHLAWWGVVITVELLRDDPTWGWVMRIVTIGEPGLYAVGVTWVAVRWFCWRRTPGPGRTAA